MALRRTVAVSITNEQDDLVGACLRSGRLASTGEAVRAALRVSERDGTGAARLPVRRETGRSDVDHA